MLGEEELFQPLFQEICFLTHFSEEEDAIPAEAVAKLRQKNPWTIRIADEERTPSREVLKLSLLVNLKSNLVKKLSPHLPEFCRDAKNSVFTSRRDLKAILDSTPNRPGEIEGSYGDLARQVLSQGGSDGKRSISCDTVSENNAESEYCECSLRLCFDWYPCSLKFCQNPEGGEYRCGIKTCRKCQTYLFPRKSQRFCFW